MPTSLTNLARRDLPAHLDDARGHIEALARGYGLDFFDTRFVMCSYEEINMIAAYGGFPRRYPHWRFGMEWFELQKSYELGLSKIYELVINTDPAYAYLMDCNLDVDQKLVMAHVYGHVDFFKNNAWFRGTDRRMLDRMANHAHRVEAIVDRHGTAAVEQFLEACLSLDNLVDPYTPYARAEDDDGEDTPDEARRPDVPAYLEPHVDPPHLRAQAAADRARDAARARGFPSRPERDVLGFLLAHAPLERWQHDLLRVVYDEARYFVPQLQTKIMNEGWATYWHTKLMTGHVLTDAEVVDYADHNAGTLATRPGQLNPYALGVKLWRHIEERWDKGRFGAAWMACEDPVAQDRWDTGAGLGRQQLFDVRASHNDVTFLDAFLTEDFVRDHGMFTTRLDRRTGRWEVDRDAFRALKRQVLEQVATRGAPRVHVIDANAFNRGELLLDHPHEGLDLDRETAAVVLGNLARLWSRPVHLQTRKGTEPVTLTHDGVSLEESQGHATREVA